MTRLPSDGGDSDTWGSVLNGFLRDTVNYAALSSSPSSGDTTITVSHMPPGMIVGSVIAIDAYTTECELRIISDITNTTITISSLKFDHSAGDAVTMIEGSVSIRLFGINADGTDEWEPLQRLVLEAGNIANGIDVDGLGARIDITQPVCFPTSSRNNRLWLRATSSFSPVISTDASITVGMRNSYCAATASDNTFTTSASHGMTVGQQIMFNAPYGETLPGSLVAGQFYYIKTTPTGTTFTISETDGGAEFDITSDGDAQNYSSIGGATLTRIHWESFRLDLEKADLNGILVSLQQPSWTRNMRIEMQVDAVTSAVGLYIAGQQSYHENLEVNTTTSCTGIKIVGTGHILRGINDNGAGTAVEIAGDCISLYDLWTEAVDVGVYFSGTSRGCNIGGTWHHVSDAEPATNPAVKVASGANVSYRVNMIRSQVTTPLFLDDLHNSVTITYADADHMNPGWTQASGAGAPIQNTTKSNQAYSESNVTTDRTYDANSTTTAELADVLGSLISDLRDKNIID